MIVSPEMRGREMEMEMAMANEDASVRIPVAYSLGSWLSIHL